MSGKFDMGDYIDVAARIVEFRAKHPEGCLRPVNQHKPFDVLPIGQETFIVYTAAAYRTPDDPCPGIGVAWEPYPGRTPYTKNSEVMVAETSAWGRAIVATLAADTKKGIASADEVRARRQPEQPRQVPPGELIMQHHQGDMTAAEDAAAELGFNLTSAEDRAKYAEHIRGQK